MTTKFRKPIAVLTALIMVLGILPTTLFASDAAVTETLVCDGKVYVDGSTFAFGPYVTLEPGEYAVYFEGSNMSGTWRVGSNSAGATFGEGSITNPSAFSARFSVFKHAENVEAWLFGSGTCTARRITRILPGELVSEGGIGTTSTHIAYGPYCSLSPGSYRVYFYGENMSGSYDVVGSGGTYASGSVPSSTAFSVDFTIPANATSIEARIAGSGTCNARQIYRIEPGELICDGSIATTSGTTSFGPYITLQPGYYRAEYTGSGLSGTYDAVGGGSSYASGTIPIRQRFPSISRSIKQVHPLRCAPSAAARSTQERSTG